MNEKLNTQDKLKKSQLFEFASKLAKVTGRFEAVRVERLGDNEKWQCIAGYNMKSKRLKILGSIIYASLVSNKRLIAIINTEEGERWVYDDQISNGWATVKTIEKDHSIPNGDFVVPGTGY